MSIAQTTFYVAPNGSSANDGTLASPWDIQTAAHSVALLTGYTVYLRGGNYPALTSDLFFQRPGVTYKAYPGEWPVIQVDTGSIVISADNVTLQGPGEMAGVNAERVSVQFGSAPTDIPTNGLYPQGKHCSITGWIIHDLKQQFVQSGADGCQLIDTVVLNTGWSGPDRGHGHAWYHHNNVTDSPAVIQNCIFGQQFGDGDTFYSVTQPLIGLTIRNLIQFDPRSTIGGENTTTVDAIVVDDCAYWQSGHDFGYLSGVKGSLSLTDSYFALNGPLIRSGWQSVVNTGNTTTSGGANVVKVYVCTTPGIIANLVVYNWQQLSSVQVDVSGLGMVAGRSYLIRQCYNPMNDVSLFTYDGSGSITISFVGRTVALPYGYNTALITLDVRFGAFRIEAV